LAAGPAAATNAMSRRGCPSRRKSTGTGFAQPNRNGARMNTNMAGSRIVPNRSMWRSGLNETRPSIFAVGSPSRHATQPCAASCSVIANKTGSTQIEAI
jgi:hypothetical protein